MLEDFFCFEKVVERDFCLCGCGKPQQTCESWPTMQKTLASLEELRRSNEGSISCFSWLPVEPTMIWGWMSAKSPELFLLKAA